MSDYFRTYSTFYAAPCRFGGLNGYDVIQIRDKDRSFACRQWCDSLDWLEDEKLVMTDRNTLEEIYRECLFETEELAEENTISIM
ncbi:MAG: hypothetical protein IKE28_04930 [Solobacterium sp.]|nr:hypothetical protein [Solobacterium sp.]